MSFGVEAKQRSPFFHLTREPPITSSHRPQLGNRMWAKLIDALLIFVVSWLVSFLWSPAYFFLVLFFWSGIDRLGRGQSPGKWLLGLHTIEMRRGGKISFYSGLIRNLPLLGFHLAFLLTGTWQLIALGLASLWIGLELFYSANIRSGVRLGDILAHTRVWDYKDDHTRFLEQFLKEERFDS